MIARWSLLRAWVPRLPRPDATSRASAWCGRGHVNQPGRERAGRRRSLIGPPQSALRSTIAPSRFGKTGDQTIGNPAILLGLSLWRLALRAPGVSSLHVWAYRMLGGRGVDRITLGGRVLLLTTVGRRSGRPRTVPLGGFQHGVDVVVAGTNGGLSRLPDWVLNLRANPEAEFQLGSEHYRAVAEFLDGHEWEAFWAELTRTYPGYADARRRAHRRIPLIRLNVMKKGLRGGNVGLSSQPAPSRPGHVVRHIGPGAPEARLVRL
jgi:F420H(2)-dependent quinone reductase